MLPKSFVIILIKMSWVEKNRLFPNNLPNNREIIWNSRVDKVCFQHDKAYGDFKDLTRRTASDKILRDKTFNIAKNPKYDEHQGGLALTVYKFVDKKIFWRWY